jgi:hypothetical protein
LCVPLVRRKFLSLQHAKNGRKEPDDRNRRRASAEGRSEPAPHRGQGYSKSGPALGVF